MIKITNCGHNSNHIKPCNMEYRAGLNHYLILLIKADAWFYCNQQKIMVKPNTVILFPPHTYIHYGCDIPGYRDDWIHFSLEKEDVALWNSLTLPLCEPAFPHDFHRLSEYVSLITDAFYSHSKHSVCMVHALMQTFFYTLDEELEKKQPLQTVHKYYPDLSRLRTQLYGNPSKDWDIHHMAATLSISSSYFQHLYKQFFDCSCQQDIIHARLERAKFYLRTSDMSIRGIAEFCGYENELHFMRQFKKFIGQTPSEYRCTRRFHTS